MSKEQELWDQLQDGKIPPEEARRREDSMLGQVRWFQTLNGAVIALCLVLVRTAKVDENSDILIIPALISAIAIVTLFFSSLSLPRHFGDVFAKKYVFWFPSANRRGQIFLGSVLLTGLALLTFTILLISLAIYF